MTKFNLLDYARVMTPENDDAPLITGYWHRFRGIYVMGGTDNCHKRA